MPVVLAIALCAACGGSSGSGSGADSTSAEPAYWPYDERGPIGLAALDDLDALPRLRRGVQTVEYSSYDREGFNDSGFSGTEEYLYRDADGATVLVDVTGPGVVYDLYLAWFSTVSAAVEEGVLDGLGPLQIFLDGAAEPTVELRPDAFFDGQHPPFVEPFVFDKLESSYGTVSYLPIPFSRSCLIRLRNGPKPLWFYQIWVQRFRDGSGMPAFDVSSAGDAIASAGTGGGASAGEREADASQAGAPDVPTLARPLGEDPKDPRVRAGNGVQEGHVRLDPPGDAVTRAVLFESQAGGRVQSIRVRPTPTSHGAQNLLRSLWIELEWDGAVAVDAPLALFFGSGHRTTPAAALPAQAVVSTVPARFLLLGEDADGFLYSYFPMPFARSARISLVYRPAEGGQAADTPPIDVDYRIETHALRDGESPGVADGYFRAQHRRVDRADFGTRIPLGDDYVLLETRGAGHYVGTVMLVDASQETLLEGDERIYVDGSLTPQVIGTATETFFQGGWYFQEKAFSLPLHGAPVLTLREGEEGGKIDATMVRLHPSDFVPFYDSIRFGIMHGAIDNVPVSYETLAFYYAVDGPALVATIRSTSAIPNRKPAHRWAVEADPDSDSVAPSSAAGDADGLLRGRSRRKHPRPVRGGKPFRPDARRGPRSERPDPRLAAARDAPRGVARGDHRRWSRRPAPARVRRRDRLRQRRREAPPPLRPGRRPPARPRPGRRGGRRHLDLRGRQSAQALAGRGLRDPAGAHPGEGRDRRPDRAREPRLDGVPVLGLPIHRALNPTPQV